MTFDPKFGWWRSWISIGVLLAVPVLSAQQPTYAQLQAEYNALQAQIMATRDLTEMERLMTLQAPIRAQLTAASKAAFAADTVEFAQLGQQFMAANADLAIALREQRRFRREPWHREFWRR